VALDIRTDVPMTQASLNTLTFAASASLAVEAAIAKLSTHAIEVMILGHVQRPAGAPALVLRKDAMYDIDGRQMEQSGTLKLAPALRLACDRCRVRTATGGLVDLNGAECQRTLALDLALALALAVRFAENAARLPVRLSPARCGPTRLLSKAVHLGGVQNVLLCRVAAGGHRSRRSDYSAEST
jgi:hypothetical protein